MKDSDQPVTLQATLWFSKDADRFLGGDRIALLEMIDTHGSITKAAKAVGISYKTAWEMVNQVNNLADTPLVDRATGGKGGGGACLTNAGGKVVQQFKTIQEEHKKFLHNLDSRLGDTDSLYQFLRRISMKVSARNTFTGVVTALTAGAVNAEVTLTLKGGIPLVATITNGAVENLGLVIGMDAYAIIKASSIVVGTDVDGARISARNIFNGTINKIIEGPVNTEIDLEIGSGNTVSAVITHDSAVRLGLQVGGKASALFKASSVIIGVD